MSEIIKLNINNDQDNSVKVISPLNIETTTFNNAFGQQIKFIDGNGNTLLYVYDLGGRLVKSTDGEGNSVSSSYDLNNNLVTQTRQDGIKTSFEYDAVNRRIKEVFDTEGLALSTQYEFNTQGDVITQIDHLN